jgi:hypothetical protein
MERLLGRPLAANEHVHHIDKNPLNNDLRNLVVLEKQKHERLHGDERQKYPDCKVCEVCGVEYRANPRKRKRQKCCSPECAMAMQIAGRRRQASSRKSQPNS